MTTRRDLGTVNIANQLDVSSVGSIKNTGTITTASSIARTIFLLAIDIFYSNEL